MKLRCNKILVTSGGSGIGFAIAKRLIGGGAKVVITGRTLEKLENAKEKIHSENLSVIQWDVSALSVCRNNIDDKYERHAIGRFIRPDEIAELAAYLMSDYGKIICGHMVVADGGDSAAI